MRRKRSIITRSKTGRIPRSSSRSVCFLRGFVFPLTYVVADSRSSSCFRGPYWRNCQAHQGHPKESRCVRDWCRAQGRTCHRFMERSSMWNFSGNPVSVNQTLRENSDSDMHLHADFSV